MSIKAFLLALMAAAAAAHTTTLKVEGVGQPKTIRVIVLNHISDDGFSYDDDTSSVVAGSVTHQPQDLPGASGYTFGYEYAKSTDGLNQIMATANFNDKDQAESAYASIYCFANDPNTPGMFGCEVNSNINYDNIALNSALFGDGDDTELSVFVIIEPPPKHPRALPAGFKATVTTDAATGETVSLLTAPKVNAVESPMLQRVSVFNTVAPAGLQYSISQSSIQAGSQTHAPQDIAGPTGYNYGYEYAPTGKNFQIMATDFFEDTAGDSGAYISVYSFVNDPAWPGAFGVQVKSNLNLCTVTLGAGVVGDDANTENNIGVYVDAPAKKGPRAALRGAKLVN